MVDCGYGDQKNHKENEEQAEESHGEKGRTENKIAREKARCQKEAGEEEAPGPRKERERGHDFARIQETKIKCGRPIGRLQGLSRSAGADSESVDELLEEGNAFEAEVVDGVENAPDADEGEVRTHEVQEDDVPDEYLDKDK